MTQSLKLREWPQTRIEWGITNFWDLSPKVGFHLDSPCFYLSDTKWHISIYPNGHAKDNSEGYIGLYLNRENIHKEHYVDYNMGIRHYHGTMLQTMKSVNKFENSHSGWGASTFIKRSILAESDAVSPDGTLTIICSAAIVEELVVPTTKEVASQTSSSLPPTMAVSQTLYSDGILNLTENFKDLYLSKSFADVTITVDGREFLAHKNVLTSRSNVFFSMFTCDMAEKSSGKIEITDCDRDTFEEFLLFLYTGKLDMVTPSNVTSLYETANKYDVQDLKTECIRCMMNELTVDNICDVMRLATIHDEVEILQAATNFFIDNAKHILVTLKWQNFSDEYRTLGNELFIKFVNKYT